MTDPIAFYKKQLIFHNTRLAQVKTQLYASSMLRLAVFVLLVLAVYLAYGNTKLVVGIVLGVVVLFLFLVSRHNDLDHQRNKHLALININETEIAVQHHNFHHLPEGNKFKDSAHYFSQDIDLFGRGSFFQYANRTALAQGSATLAALFTENTIDHIEEKQKAIQELSQLPEWRQEFSAAASMVKKTTPTEVIIAWLDAYRPFLPKTMQYVPKVFSVLSATVFVLFFLELLPGSALLFWLLMGLAITAVFTKKITKLAVQATKIKDTFGQYHQLLVLVEEAKFKAPLVQEQQKILATGPAKVPQTVMVFFGMLDTLDNNNNIIYLLFTNGFLLQGITTCYQMEKWIEKNGKDVKSWFDVVAFFDAYNSLGNFAFNHPTYTFPVITDRPIVLHANQVGHPLLPPLKSVFNDIRIDKEQFFIITGANMAGKSTFLRTVSLQIMMANVGLPVCAEKVDYSPMKLITSMRTTDSLTDEESYFFSELKRLRFIVEELESDRYFIVLDEILKGTNSSDKAIGSRKFLEKLVGAKATGIIATHDLSLCEAAKEIKQLQNYYFDAEIVNNELHFDYTFKKGICQNMNASFLLKKMGIVD